MDNFYGLAVDTLVVLTTIVLLLSAYALGDRWLSERSEARVQRIRGRQGALLRDFLAGRITQDAVQLRMRLRREIARGVLLQEAGRLPHAERGRLRQLYGVLGLQQRDLAQLRERSPLRRASAANRLGFLGSEDVKPAVRALLDDPDLDARLAAAQALVELGDADAAPLILSAIVLRGEWPLRRGTEILMALGPAVILPLRGFLRAGPAQGSPGEVVAINVLGLLESQAALPELLQCMQHTDLELRVASAKALGAIGGAGAMPALELALGDQQWEVRSMAAKALGRLRDAAAGDALHASLADPAWWVRYNAAQALYDIGERGIALLQASSKHNADRFARDISRQVLEEHGGDPVRAGETMWA
ncbi:MAG: HEAT repeat domain-containing protein [Luteimonas sp.]